MKKKNGIFYRSTLALFYLSLINFSGCAAFIQLDDREEDSGAYDRGYTAEDEEQPCTGRFCDPEDNQARAREKSFRSHTEEDSDGLHAVNKEDLRIRKAIEAKDVVIGMDSHDVYQSWGSPMLREAAGDGRSGHERWTYGSRYSLNGSRTIIFENGKVAGWSR